MQAPDNKVICRASHCWIRALAAVSGSLESTDRLTVAMISIEISEAAKRGMLYVIGIKVDPSPIKEHRDTGRRKPFICITQR